MIRKLQINRIIAATDFSDGATAALSVASRIAQRFSSDLTLLHVVALKPRLEVIPLQKVSVTGGVHRHDVAVAALEDYRDTHVPRSIRSEPLVASGNEASVIVATARRLNADLIVMGTRGRTGLTRVLLGSVAQQIIHKAGRPVLTVRQNKNNAATARDFARILCPINYSRAAARALDQAVLFAAAFEAELITPYFVETKAADELEREIERLRLWIGDLPDSIRVKPVVRRGRAADEVLRMVRSSDADLLVIGAKRKRSSTRTTFGSTTEHLIRHAPCPVLTVPAGGRRR